VCGTGSARRLPVTRLRVAEGASAELKAFAIDALRLTRDPEDDYTLLVPDAPPACQVTSRGVRHFGDVLRDVQPVMSGR